MASPFDTLHDEVLVNILLHLQRPFAVEISKYRPVCSKWNKLSRTNDFWKALCVKDMGPNIAPLKLYQGAKILTEARDYVIPIIKAEGNKVAVDFMAYYRIRRQFVSLIHWLNTLNQKKIKLWQGKGTDLTLQNIQAFVKLPWETVKLNHAHTIGSFLFLIIPPLLVHGRKEVAQQAFNLIASRGADEGSELLVAYAKNCMKVHRLAKEHKLADLALKAFEAAGKAFRTFMETELLSEPGAAGVFDELVTQSILYGAVSKPNDTSTSLAFKYPEEKYWALLVKGDKEQQIQFPEEFMPPLISIAQREFKLATDWHVKASALAVSYYLPVGTIEAAADVNRFACDVLINSAEHNEVQYAAMVLINTVFYEWHNNDKFLLSAVQYTAIFQYFTNKLVELPPNQVLAALQIVLLLGYSVNISHEVIADNLLDKFHENLFKVLLVPNVIANSVVPALRVIKKLHVTAHTFGGRLTKYLKKYREVLFTIAQAPKLRGDATTKEDVIAVFVNFCCQVKEFEHEAIDVIKQIEDKTIGFPVRLPQFYGACGKACSKLPGADVDHILKTIFGMLPAKFATFGCSRPLADFLMEVAEKIKEERKKRESRGEEEEEEDEEFDSDDDMEEPPQRTDFLPYTESQFKQACEKAKLVPKENTEEFQSCFQFTKPEPIKFDKNSRFIKKLDLLENIETEIGDLAETFNGCQGALSTVLKIGLPLHEGFLPHAQKAFHFVLGYCRLATYLHAENLRNVQILFRMILPYLDSDHILHYARIVLNTIADVVAEENSLDEEQATAILDTMEMIIDELAPINYAPTYLFKIIFDCFTELLQQMPLSTATKPPEYRVTHIVGQIFKKWPRFSLPALTNSKLCAWISESLRESEADTVSHMAALFLCCHIGLRFGIMFVKGSLAFAPGSVVVRPHDLRDALDAGFDRFSEDGTKFNYTKLEPPPNAYKLLQRAIILLYVALIDDELDVLSYYTRLTFDTTILADAIKSEGFDPLEEIQELVDKVTDGNFMDLIFEEE